MDAHVEEEGHTGPEHDLEHQELQAHGGRLAEKDAGRVDPREPQPVSGPFTRLDGHAPLNGQHGGEQHGDPEDARRGVPQRGTVGADGEGDQDEHQHGEGDHLPQPDPRPCFDPEVLAGHQERRHATCHVPIVP